MRISGRRIRKSAGGLSSKDDNQTRRCRHLQVFLITVFICVSMSFWSVCWTVANTVGQCCGSRPASGFALLYFGNLDPHPDPHQIKSRSRSASNKNKDLDPHQSDKLDSEPDPDPHQFADLPKCMEYEPIWALFKGLSLHLEARIWIRIRIPISVMRIHKLKKTLHN